MLGGVFSGLGMAAAGQLVRLVLRGAESLSDFSAATLLGPHSWSKLVHLEIEGAQVRTPACLRTLLLSHVWPMLPHMLAGEQTAFSSDCMHPAVRQRLKLAVIGSTMVPQAGATCPLVAWLRGTGLHTPELVLAG